MFEAIRREIEQEAGQRELRALDRLVAGRLNSVVYYVIMLLSAFVAYTILLAAALLSDHFPSLGRVLLPAAILLAGVLVVAVEYIRTSHVTWHVTIWAKRTLDRRRAERVRDFLRPYYWSVLFFSIGPFLTLLAISAVGDKRLIVAGSAEFRDACHGVHRAVGFAGVLVAAQTTLFSFLFSHSLGRYSSKLARVIMEHAAVRALLVCGLVGLAVPLALAHTGVPATVNQYFWLFYLSLFACLTLTILVACRGVDTDALIVFAGQHYARKLRRLLKPPAISPEGKMSFWWRILAAFQLDFRHPERFVLHAESYRGITICKSYLMSLFNAASEAIRRNQQEALQSCLHAIGTVMNAYSLQRAKYHCSTDSVYSYCNDHFAALISLASRSPNEHMATDIVAHIGSVAATGLRICGAPSAMDESEEMRRQRNDHPVSGYWFVLLRESFRRLHTLQRTPAPSEVISQLKALAIRVDGAGFPTTVQYSCLPAFQEVLGTCLASGDAYHISLVSECCDALMCLWAHHLTQPTYLSGHGRLHGEIPGLILRSVQKGAGTGLSPLVGRGVPETLTVKLSHNQITIQDVFYLAMHRRIQDIHRQRDVVDGLCLIVDFLVDLVCEQLKTGGHAVKHYLEALYEISYLVIKKLPDTLGPMRDPVYDNYPDGRMYAIETRVSNPRKQLEVHLFIAWGRIAAGCHQAEPHTVFEWEQDFLGFLGLTILRKGEGENPWIVSGIDECVGSYTGLMETEMKDYGGRLRHGNPAFLQLLGAWLFRYAPQSKSLPRILDILAHLHVSFDFHFPHPNGRYGCLGYPEMMSGPFYLPPLRSVRAYISEKDWADMKQCETSLMDTAVLHRFYERIQWERQAILVAKGSWEGEELFERLLALLRNRLLSLRGQE